MKKPSAPNPGGCTLRDKVSALEQIPNVGPATAEGLRRLGIRRPADLMGRDAYDMYDRLCDLDGKRHDPCVMDVFLAAVDYMNGGPPTQWWKFTAERKRRMAAVPDGPQE